MTKPRLLIAEDFAPARALMVKLLAPEFDIVADVPDGLQLIQAALKHKPDLIVADIHMPALSGPQAIEQLAQSGRSIPFVLVSTDDRDAEAWIEWGARAFVRKIEMSRELLQAVKAAVDGLRPLESESSLHPLTLASVP